MSNFQTATAIATALTALQVFAAPVHANCLEGGDASNPTLNCTAADSGNIDDDRDNLAVTVDGDARIVRANGRPVQLEGSDQSLVNQGLIESGDDDAVRGKGANLTVDNSGTILGGDRGIRLQDDADGFTLNNLATGEILARRQAVRLDSGDALENAVITNHGLIRSTDGRAVQSRGPGGTVINHGTLRGGEEVVEAREDFTLQNHGTIALNGLEWDAASQTWTNNGATDDEDGVQFASGRADNHGVILGTDDGIDIDEGVIHNHATGVIVSTGSESDPLDGGSGIDVDETFEPTVGADRISGPLTIINEGYIEGVQAIGTDPAHASAITIRNSGTLRGRSGTAIALGDGDDTLELGGGRIFGTVVLGGGTNTLRVLGADAGAVHFDTAPDVVDMTAAPNHALFSGTVLAVAEPQVFSATDRLLSDGAFSLSQAALAQPNGKGWWLHGAVSAQDDDLIGSDMAGTFALGHDFGIIGVFAAFNNAEAGLSDDLHEIDMTNWAVGLRTNHGVGPDTVLSAAVFAGQSRMKLVSPGFASGTGDSDGTLYGMTLGASHTVPADRTGGQIGYDFSAQAGFVAASFDDFAASGLGGASFDSRTARTAFASLEAGVLVPIANSATLRPFIGAHAVSDNNEDVTMSLNGVSNTFGLNDTDRLMVSLGADIDVLSGASSWTARAEARFDDDDNVQGMFSVSMKF